MKTLGIPRFSRKKGSASSTLPPSGNNHMTGNGTSDPLAHETGTFGHSSDFSFGADVEGPPSFQNFNETNFDMFHSLRNVEITGHPSDNSSAALSSTLGDSANSSDNHDDSIPTEIAIKGNLELIPNDRAGGNSFPSFKGTASTGHENASTLTADSFMDLKASVGEEDNVANATKNGIPRFSRQHPLKKRRNQGSMTGDSHKIPRGTGRSNSIEKGSTQKASAVIIQTNAAGTVAPSDHATRKEKSLSGGATASVTPVAQFPKTLSDNNEDLHMLEQRTLVTPSLTEEAKPTSNCTNEHLAEIRFQGKTSPSPSAQKVGRSSQNGASIVAPAAGKNQGTGIHVDNSSGTSPEKSVVQNRDDSDPTLGAPDSSAATETGGRESFDELFSQFLVDQNDSADLNEQGEDELLDLDVDFEIAYSVGLKLKAEMLDMIDQLETIESKANRAIREHGGELD